MDNLISLVDEPRARRESFLGKLADVEGTIMEAVADHDDALRDRDIDAIAHASTLASNLFSLTHDIAIGLPIDSAAAQQRVRDMLAGLSALADEAFPTEDEDHEAWA